MTSMWASRAGDRMRKVMKPMPRSSISASTLWVVTRWSRTKVAGSVPVASCQWSQKTSTSRAWVDFERSALAYTRLWVPASWAKKVSTDGCAENAVEIVLFEGGVLAPVHDGVEVQIEVGPLGQADSKHRPVKRAKEAPLALMGQPVAVGGKCRHFGSATRPAHSPAAGSAGRSST